MIIDLDRNQEYRTVDYTHTQHASPLSPSSTEGAVPSMSASLGPEVDPVAYMTIYRKNLRLEEFNVSADFTASEPAEVDGVASVAGLSDLENFNVDLIWPANHWHFFSAIGHLINTVRGVDPIAIDGYTWDTMEGLNHSWVMPNLVGNGWVLLKQYLSAHGLTFFDYNWWDPVNAIKLSTVYDSFNLDEGLIISSSVNLNTSDASDKVTAHRYEYTDFLSVFKEVVPKFESTEGESIISVESGEELEVSIQTSVSMSKLDTNTPRCLDMIWDSVEYFTSVYTVVGNDDKPIMAKQWTDAGGSLTVDINKEDPTKIDVKVVGAKLPDLAPFRIAASSGKNHDYSSLHVYAKGVGIKKFPYTVYTGAVQPIRSDIESEFDNPFLRNHENMPNALYMAAREEAGFNWSLSFSVPPHQGAMLINDRVFHRGHWWRIDSATVTGTEISYTCTEASEITHFNERYEGLTIAEFNSRMGDRTMTEFAAVMLNA